MTCFFQPLGLCTCSSSAYNTVSFFYWLRPSPSSKCKRYLRREICPDPPFSDGMPLFSTTPPSYCLYPVSITCEGLVNTLIPLFRIGVLHWIVGTRRARALPFHGWVCDTCLAQHTQEDSLTHSWVNKWTKDSRLASPVNSVMTLSKEFSKFGPFYTVCLCVPTCSLSYSGCIWKPKWCLVPQKHAIEHFEWKKRLKSCWQHFHY